MTQRNLVVVVADTWRHVQPFDRPNEPAMPFLDGFARDATVFDQMFASSSWTAPSHVSLLSGANPWETHFHVPGAGPRSPRHQSLADKWRAGGGASAAFSANFLVAPALGTATGYDRYNPGFRAGLAGYVQLALTLGGYERRLWEAFGESQKAGAGAWSRGRGRLARAGGTGVYKSVNAMRSGPTLLRALAKFLRQRDAREDRRSTPLHLFFNFAEPHEPYLVGQNGGSPGDRATVGHLPTINYGRFLDHLGAPSLPPLFWEAYRSSLRSTDDCLAQLVDLLKRRGVLENAVLAVVSDHGQNLGEHGFFGHGFYLYDELVKIPAYLWEFRDGRPVGQTAPPEEWVDHRHFHDLLASFRPDGSSVDLHDVLTASLERRGPASSYYEGPGPRPPDGLLVKAPKVPPYRLLRIQKGAETALVRSDTKGGQLEALRLEGPDRMSSELGATARKVLVYDLASTPAGPKAAGTEGMDAQVDARLKSWGYD